MKAHIGVDSKSKIIHAVVATAAKNAHRLFVTCALANLFMARRKLMAA